MSAFAFDTCFLIDLERERRGRIDSGRAHAFLRRHPADRPCWSWTVAGEFGEGFGGLDHTVCAGILALFDMLPIDAATAHHYAVITRHLRKRNLLIGANDLWIAAASLAQSLPLVTRDANHFNRVPGLVVVEYECGPAGSQPEETAGEGRGSVAVLRWGERVGGP